MNIRVTDGFMPFLRRPFSVSRVEAEHVEIVFNIVGVGTQLLSLLRPGDVLDVVGPLGTPFRYSGDFSTALIVAGGLGAAPFPLLTSWLQREEKQIVSFVGARSAYQLYRMHLKNPHYATDDGTAGMKGTVVELLDRFLKSTQVQKPKIFGCGPTKMLKVLSEYAQKNTIACELSLEGDMACGIGLCQGCPVERVGGSNGKKKYALVCTEGPSFQCQDILLS
ncbi:MAG: dihydroorotate dehydrogenase electron transfer subunit [Ignavibacteriae bacterium]|nr:dihydroorotate dehydrogenase electron transfer subunit [Ignavibacteriota bacterium]